MKNMKRFLARMGSRGCLGQALVDYAADGNYFYFTSADLAHASGFDRLIKTYPERFVDTGIAEQNLIGVAAGLAASGIPAVATTWAMFASARVADQVRNLMGYMQRNVKLVGMDSGLTQGRFGNSHGNPPDLAIMRAIPGITILAPADGIEIYYAVKAAMMHDGPVYIRLTGGALLPMLYQDEFLDYRIGRVNCLRKGERLAIISCGVIIENVIKAAELLSKQGVEAEVIDMHTISPLDIECLDHLANFELVATVEEHLLQGGLGSAVAEYYCDKKKRPRQIMFGLNEHIEPGTTEYLRECNGLQPEQIAARVLKEL